MQTVSDTPVLERFIAAQDAGDPSVYARALDELRSGRKRSHWIWFVMPQLEGLGRSAMAERYGLNGLEEAKAYLAEPILRSRLEETIAVITDQLLRPDQSLERLMGGLVDTTKTISSLTLFAAAGLPEARALLEQIGRHCETTQCRLGIDDRGQS